MIVLDTNVVSELMRTAPDQAVLLWLNSQPVPSIFITAITVVEMQTGVEKLYPGRRRDDMQGLVSAILGELGGRILPFDSGAALHYAQLIGPIMRTKATMEPLDYQIAAIARFHGAAVATLNVKHFKSTGIEIINPWSS
ncbi:type II toxin-antitoxin system VapC family toxin [uncultured Devosia sp.]|uniref:type II toxin-antitoxin system VapC family toxin n=1 Tax=uncultured Devosia sp. TaxID=211434 RepID=UPI0035CB42D7